MASLKKKGSREEALHLAEGLREVLSHWVRTTRDRAGTPSTAKIETLRLLQDSGPLTIAALAQRRLVKHQSMRLVIEQLAMEGTITKSVDPHDRRSQMVRITEKGQAVIQHDQRSRTAWIATLVEACSTAEQQQIAVAICTLEHLLLSRTTPGLN
ncbi:MAG: MarR family winged helix-turn-helix transcriptional regulator [Janthinobacterium lividum]